MPDSTGFSSIGSTLRNLGEIVAVNSALGFYAMRVARQAVIVVLIGRWLLTQESPTDLVSSLKV